MTDAIINFQDWSAWLQTPPGQLLARWEQQVFDQAVADVFGYHAVQLGMPMLDALAHNRMPHRYVCHDCEDASRVQVVSEFSALPFDASVLDLVVLPHTLELSGDPHATLRDVERVLVPEGRVLITGFNPASLWGLAQHRAHLYRRLGRADLYLPASGEFLAYRRLRDWLRLLGFEVEEVHFGLWQPALRNAAWLERFDWMNRLGQRWWPIFGSVYSVQAVKRVRGMRLMEPAWKARLRVNPAPATVAQQSPTPRSADAGAAPRKQT